MKWTVTIKLRVPSLRKWTHRTILDKNRTVNKWTLGIIIMLKGTKREKKVRGWKKTWMYKCKKRNQ